MENEMQLTNKVDWPARHTEEDAAEERPKVAGILMEARAHCAYNQTRECFLGLEVDASEFTPEDLHHRLTGRALKSGEGLWVIPFRGFPTTDPYAPLDLIYLDEDCRVIETVESYPTFLTATSSRSAPSLLILPAHSIYSSQTQLGDQLVLCVAEEMAGRLEQLSSVREDAYVVEGVVLLREQPLWSGGPGLLELESRTDEERINTSPTHEMSLIEPGVKAARPPKNWLERWWSPDPRKAPRELSAGLAAYYWNGAAPKAHSVKDVSSTGLYVVTEERWYPGTLVLMTLQKAGESDRIAERSIQVMSRAVRWGNDGVGLQFVLPDQQDTRKGRVPQGPHIDGAGRKELARFLKGLLKAKE
jgi:hypothetical protein